MSVINPVHKTGANKHEIQKVNLLFASRWGLRAGQMLRENQAIGRIAVKKKAIYKYLRIKSLCRKSFITCARARPTATISTIGLNKKSPTAKGSAFVMMPLN